MSQVNTVNPINDRDPAPRIHDILRGVLSNRDDLECCLAVGVLAQTGGAEAQDLLIDCLHHGDPDVRSDAASALAGFQGAQVVNALIDNLKIDPAGEIKVVYIQALQALKASPSVNMLRVLAQGRGEDHDIYWEDDQTGWDDWLDVQRAAIEALGHLSRGEEADATVAVILEVLADLDGQDLWAIGCRALARLGAPGCTALNSLLAGGSPLNRKRIATALACAEGVESEDILLKLLQDADINVRIAAIESGSERALESVCHAGLQNDSPAVRAKTLETFDDWDKTVFITALNDIDTGVKIAACHAIMRMDKPVPGLGLVRRAEDQLRSSTPAFLAALVGAMTAAEPDQAAGFVEEIVNHKATAPVVRLGAMRALGRLVSAGAVDCLAIGVTDKKQDIRLEAIVALGRIAKTSGGAADRATYILASAIQGELVAPPPGWQPEQDNIVRFAPKKSQISADEGEAKVNLSREGETLPEKPVPETPPEIQETVAEIPPPLSTLEAIGSHQPADPATAAPIEISSDDLAFLELTGSRPGKQKINPQSNVPAHIDVQRLASRIAADTGNETLVPALAIASLSRDAVICETSLESLNRLGSDGVDISPASAALLQQSNAPNKAARCRAIDALAWIDSKDADAALERALQDPSGMIRASGLAAIAAGGGDVGDLQALCCDEDRRVRETAAELLSKQSSAQAIPELLAYATIENAVHKADAARLLTGYGKEAILALLGWIRGDNQIRRIVGLEVLARVLATD